MSAPQTLPANWPRKEFDRVKALLAEQNPDAPGAVAALNQALFVFPNGEIAQSLLDMGVIPDQTIMRQAVFSTDAVLMEKLLQNGGEATSEMLHDAVKNLNPAVTKVLLKYGAVPNEETERLAQTASRFITKGETLASSFETAKKERRAVRVRNFKRKVKSQFEV